MDHIIYPNGQATVTIPAGEKIAVFTRGLAQVLQQVGYPNEPASLSAVASVSNTSYLSSAYASGATLVVNNAGASPVFYQVGTDPLTQQAVGAVTQGSPVALNATGAVTAAAMAGGIVTSTTAAAVDGTVPTGTAMDAAAEFAVGDSFDWSVINTGGSNAFTVTAATDHTLVGAGAVAASSSGRFRTRKTAATTFVTYRLS